MEFLSYRILYLLFSRNRAGTSSFRPPLFTDPLADVCLVCATELNNTLRELTPDQKVDESVSHALAVRLALSEGNYTRLFRLFNAAPKMSGYVMDSFVPRERVTALVTMCKA